MELRQLRYFVVVAEELHFGRAAARLHMAQPPLSRQIRQLEDQLRVTLLERTKRRVELTAAGRVFLAEARRVLVQAQRAMEAAQRASRGESGHLAIGFVPSADLDILPRVLKLWNTRFPRVEIEPHPLLRCQQIDAFRSGRIQIGFVPLPFDDAGLTVEAIQREPMVAVLPERHRLARRARVEVADLRGDAMIVFARRPWPSPDHIVIRACQQAGFTPRVLHATDSIQTNLGLIAAGLGVTLLPASIRNLRRAGVVYRALAPPVPEVEMAVAYGRDDRSTIVPAFLQVVREVTAQRRRPEAACAGPQLRAAKGGGGA